MQGERGEGPDAEGASAPTRSLWRRAVCLLDMYGHQAIADPRRQPRSLLGLVASLCALAAMCVLIIVTVIGYVWNEKTMRMGGRAPLNGLYQYQSAGSSVRKQTWPSVFVPSLSLKAKVTFFTRKEDRRSIHKVEISDRNGYHPTQSSDLTATPIGYGVFSRQEVPRNSFDERVSRVVQPNRPGVRFGLEDRRYFAQVLDTQESMAVLRNIERSRRDQTSDKFTDHRVDAFMRFDEFELKKLKKCQLQVWLYNEGQFRALADNELAYDNRYFDHLIFNGQESNAVTWDPSSFVQGNPDNMWRHGRMNLINISKSYSRELLDRFLDYEFAPGKTFGDNKNLDKGDYMSWAFVFAYVNNFNYTVQEPICAGYPDFRTGFVDGVDPGQIRGDILVLQEERAWLFPPFSIVVQGQGILERMVVVNVTVFKNGNATEQHLKLLRTNDTIDGQAIQSDISVLARPPTAESGWVCPLEWFGNGLCNCECGGVDIDCVRGGDNDNVAETGCDSSRAFGPICSHTGRCAETGYRYSLTVSEGCSMGNLLIPGETVRVGFQGDADEYVEAAQDGEGCVPCPYDKVFGGMPKRSGAQQELMCTPTVQVDAYADLNSQDGIEWGTITPSPNGSSAEPTIKLRVNMPPGFDFPKPQNSSVYAESGLPADIAIGCCSRKERVSVVRAEALPNGMQALTLRHVPPPHGGGPSEAPKSITWSVPKSVFGETSGRSCRYGMMAELVSPILEDSMSIEVMLPINMADLHDFDTGYYFPQVSDAGSGGAGGQYEVRLQGRTVLVTHVSRPVRVRWTGRERFVQTLFISEPPRFSIGGKSFVVEPAPAGATSIVIRDPVIVGLDATDFQAGCTGNTECFRPKVHILADEGHFIYTVNSINGSVLSLNEELASPIDSGDAAFSVHSLRYSNRARNWGCDTPYTTYVYAIQTLVLADQGAPYNPADRHKGTWSEPGAAGATVKVETGMFMSLMANATVRPLCPNIVRPEAPQPAQRFRSGQGWEKWRVFHDATVENCWQESSLKDVCAVSHQERVSGREVCPEIMPPTSVESFEYHFPVNNKWLTKFRTYDRNTINDPEYLVDLNVDLHFPYDASNRKAHDAFVSKQAERGDSYFDATQNSVEASYYTGALHYKGRPASYGGVGEKIPAGNPVLSLKLMLQTAKYAAEDIFTAQGEGGAINWPSDEAGVRKLVEAFDPLPIEFDLEAMGGQPDSMYGLELHPGYEYSVEAFVSIQPLLDESSGAVYGWRSSVVRKRQYRTPLGTDEKSNLARLRITISFDPTASAEILATRYTLYQAALDVGSSVLYVCIFLFLLRHLKGCASRHVFLPSRSGSMPKRLEQLTHRAKELKTS